MPRIELMDWARARPLAAPIRVEVFVREQRVPAELEMDEMDANCLHAIAFDGERAVATGRLLPDGHVGRMAVLKGDRGRGNGSAVLWALVEAAARRGDTEAALSAQKHALAFYRAHGFVEQGGEYLEAGIPHQGMILRLGPLLLAECALLAARIAPQSCAMLPGGATCAPLHASWPVLKLIGNVGTPGADQDFFRHAFAPYAHGRPRVLVSGASDHGILEQVLGGLGEASKTSAITVLDRCDTPLLLNRWYAERLGLRIETRRSDVLAYAAEKPFDVICAHNFMEELAQQHWPALAMKWRDNLAAQGRVIAVIRLRNEAELAADLTASSQPRDFRPAIERANAGLPPALRLPVEPTAANLGAYWLARRSSGVGTIEAARKLLGDAGFSLEHVDEGAAPVSGRPGMSKSRRVRLIARRA